MCYKQRNSVLTLALQTCDDLHLLLEKQKYSCILVCVCVCVYVCVCLFFCFVFFFVCFL